MDDIIIIEKPNHITWDNIHELLLQAHKRNIKKGIISLYAQLPGEEIEKRLGKDGRCWVAMDKDKIIGTTAVSFFIGQNWWNRNKKVAHSCFTGILQQYQGIGLVEQLDAKLIEYVRSLGVEMIQGDTAEGNRAMRKLAELGGYKTVDYFAPKSHHYSIHFVKWYGNCPFSDKYINRRYKVSRYLTRLQYKPGKEERNWLLSKICNIARRGLEIRWTL